MMTTFTGTKKEPVQQQNIYCKCGLLYIDLMIYFFFI